MIAAPTLVFPLLISIAVGSTAAILSWRAIPRPGARWLAVLLFGQVWWSLSSFFRLRTPGIEGKTFWLQVMWVGVVILPLAWVLFALDYSGRDRYITKRNILILATIPLITILLILTNQYHDLISVSTAGYTDLGILQVGYSGLWYWVIAAYTYFLGALGLVFLFGLLINRAVIFQKQGIALLLGLIFPWVTNLLHVTGILNWGIDPTPVAFAPSGVVFFLAIKRFDLLRANPAPTRQARQMVFNGVQEGAIIVDMDEHVIDMNERAEAILDTSRQEALGAPCSEVLSGFEELPTTGTMEDYLSIERGGSSRQFEVEVKEIASKPGNSIGRLITINEVTELLRQQQRLEVLHRVLRHNIRTETNLILGYAEADEGEFTGKIRTSAETIEALGEKGREAIELFSMAREETEPRKLTTMIEDAVGQVEGEFPEVTVQYEYTGPEVAVDGLLDAVFRNAIENAAAHNEGQAQEARIEVSTDADRARVRVADDGPGIGEHELAVLSEGTETPLEHGSGIGLWIITWGVDIADGEVTFKERETGGTEVVIEVPVLRAEERDA